MTPSTARRLFFASATAALAGLTVAVAGGISSAYPAPGSERQAADFLGAGMMATAVATAAAAASGAAMRRADHRAYLAAVDQHRRTLAAIRAGR